MTKLRPGTLALVLAASIAGGCAGDRPIAPTEMRGGVMTDWYEHRTLYTNSNDATNPTSSTCDSAYCTWQWAYKGKPLYFYVGDTKTGDKTGDGRNNGVWRVVTAN